MALISPAQNLGLAAGTALLISLTATGCVDIVATDFHYSEREERRFTTDGAPNVVLATFDGGIEVDSWDRNEVLVEIEKRGTDHADVESIRVEMSQTGDDVDVAIRDRVSGDRDLPFSNRRSASLRVTLPRSARLHARSGDGRIVVRDLKGEVSVQTGDGSIRVEDIDGSVDAQSGDGSIRVDGALTRVRARSGDGAIVIRAVAGSVAQDDWTIVTGDGSVTLELPDAFDAELDARTGDGRVTVRSATDVSEDRRTSRRNYRARLGAGGRTVRIHTGDGSITVRPS